jgi:hypothetical protein
MRLSLPAKKHEYRKKGYGSFEPVGIKLTISHRLPLQMVGGKLLTNLFQQVKSNPFMLFKKLIRRNYLGEISDKARPCPYEKPLKCV